jgi:hypothetical protein
MDRGPETTGTRFSIEARPPVPPFFYFRLRTATVLPNWVAAMRPRFATEFHDLLIPHMVSKLKGNAINIGFDKQFDQAVERIRRALRLQ